MSENIQKNYYAIIPANVRYDKRLNPLARLLYAEITALCNEKGFCWATNNYFASLYEVSEITISRYISELKKYHYIRVSYDKTRENIDKRKIYISTLNEIQESNNQNCIDGIIKNDKRVSSKMIRPSNQNCIDGIIKNDKENNINNNINNNLCDKSNTHDLNSLVQEGYSDEVDYLLNKKGEWTWEVFQEVYLFWYIKLTGQPVQELIHTVSAKKESINKLEWLKTNFKNRKVHCGVAIFETLEFIAQDKSCLNNFKFRGSNYLDGVISRLVDINLAATDPVSDEGKNSYQKPAFDYFKY